MIHHISISAENPYHVATVLAEILKGKAVPFPVHPGSYIAAALDEFGTMIEVYPLDIELMPGQDDEEVVFETNSLGSFYSATHAAISVPMVQAQIEAIGEREGWRVVRCDRGPFEVIEFWIENRLMMEFLPAELSARYLAFMQPETLTAFMTATMAIS